MSVAMVERILRPIVKAVAGLAGVVFLFDNHTAGLILLASIAVLTLCGIVWMIFLREDEDGSGYWPPRPLR
jgi:hypothetical protein